METLFRDFKQAHLVASGPLLATTITPIAPPIDPNRLRKLYNSTNAQSVAQDVRYGLLAHSNTDLRFLKPEGTSWVDIYVAYWKAVGEILDAENAGAGFDWTRVYEAWKEVANALIRGYSSSGFQAWTVPCLYVAGRYLRVFAIRADGSSKEHGDGVSMNDAFQDDVVGEAGEHEKLEDAARVMNRMFTLCVSDRAPIEESRKWGLYYTTILLFKTYFKLNSIGLSKNILRALEASKADMPPMEAYPKSHIVTFKYYVGVILFLEEDYMSAEENLTSAWHLCHNSAQKNKELILTYLIPTRLLTTRTLPTATLLFPYPRLRTLFSPLITSIRTGSLSGFDDALSAGEDEFVKRRIYLTLERGRDICLRNLLRKVYVAGGMLQNADGTSTQNRRTRVPLEELAAAIRVGSRGGEGVENDEVECLLANMIYKNLMKGYISRAHGLLVLSKKADAFPGTGI